MASAACTQCAEEKLQTEQRTAYEERAHCPVELVAAKRAAWRACRAHETMPPPSTYYYRDVLAHRATNPCYMHLWLQQWCVVVTAPAVVVK